MVELEKLYSVAAVGAITYGVYCMYKSVHYIFFESYNFKEHKKYESFKIASNFHQCVREIIKILNRKPNAYRVLGMDCEFTSDSTKGGSHPKPAILQLASPDNHCAIFQLQVMQNEDKERVERDFNKRFLPTSLTVLTQILGDPSILKVGVGVVNDAKYLEETYGLITKGFLDIRHLAELVNIKPSGLDELGKTVLGRGKFQILGKKIPWENKTLPYEQINYAIEDARLSLDVFMELNKKYINQKHSLMKRLFWSEKKFWKYTVKEMEKFIGKPFNIKKQEIVEPQCVSWKKYLTLKLFGPNSMFVVLESATYCHICSIPCSKKFRRFVVPVDYDIDDQAIRTVCQRCFRKCCQFEYAIREELSEMCGAPRPDYKDSRLVKAKELAANILNFSKEGSQDEYELLEFRLCELVGLSRRQLSRETLQTILCWQCWPGSSHGQFVHDYFESSYPNGLEILREKWHNYEWFM